MKVKSRNIILTIGMLVIGYVAGLVINLPEVNSKLSLGDISKVRKYHKNIVDSKETSALEEKLKSDTLAFNEELVTVGLINSRMTDFANLVDYSIIVASDKEEFCEEINSLINVRELSENAIQAAKVASASLEYIASGEANELATDYEHVAQNMIVSFLMVDRQVQLGKQFVDIADKYLENNSKENSPEIALARDLWAEYCAESAYLNDDKKEFAYWDGQKCLCNKDMLGKVLVILPQRITKLESSNLANKIDVATLRDRFDKTFFLYLGAGPNIIHGFNAIEPRRLIAIDQLSNNIKLRIGVIIVTAKNTSNEFIDIKYNAFRKIIMEQSFSGILTSNKIIDRYMILVPIGLKEPSIKPV